MGGFVGYAFDIVPGNGCGVGCGDEDGGVVGAIDSVVFDGDVAEYAGQGRVFPAGGDAFYGNDAARHGCAVVAVVEGVVAYGHVAGRDAFVEMDGLGDDQNACGGDVFECAVFDDGVADLDEHASSAVALEGAIRDASVGKFGRVGEHVTEFDAVGHGVLKGYAAGETVRLDGRGLDFDGCVGEQRVLRREFDVVTGIGCREHVQVVSREHGTRVDDLHDIEEESAFHVDRVVALSVEEAVPDNEVARTSAEVASVGGDGDEASRAGFGLDDAVVERHIFAAKPGKGHAGTGVDGDVLKGHFLAVVGCEGVVGVDLVAEDGEFACGYGLGVRGQGNAEGLRPDEFGFHGFFETVDVESVAAWQAGVGFVVHEGLDDLAALDGEFRKDLDVEPRVADGGDGADGKWRAFPVDDYVLHGNLRAASETEACGDTVKDEFGTLAVDGDAVHVSDGQAHAR